MNVWGGECLGGECLTIFHFGHMRKNNVFCRKLANMRLAKELKAFFCIRLKPTNPRSLLLTLTHSSGSISGSLGHCHSLSIRLTLAHSGSLRHLLAHKVLARSNSNPDIWLDFFLTNASCQYDYANVLMHF